MSKLLIEKIQAMTEKVFVYRVRTDENKENKTFGQNCKENCSELQKQCNTVTKQNDYFQFVAGTEDNHFE